MRVTELLDFLGIVDVASTQRAQMDVTSSFARRHRMTAAAVFRDAEQVARVDSLAAWDGTVAADRREPVYFYAWLELVRFRVARELYEGPPGYFPTSVLDRMLEAGQDKPRHHDWCGARGGGQHGCVSMGGCAPVLASLWFR